MSNGGPHPFDAPRSEDRPEPDPGSWRSKLEPRRLIRAVLIVFVVDLLVSLLATAGYLATRFQELIADPTGAFQAVVDSSFLGAVSLASSIPATLFGSLLLARKVDRAPRLHGLVLGALYVVGSLLLGWLVDGAQETTMDSVTSEIFTRWLPWGVGVLGAGLLGGVFGSRGRQG